ncbi:MAG: hypothetical protein KC457_01300 [Myxococcales bacterium]|nr:hypothetical protein [Myxococcales bacterium]
MGRSISSANTLCSMLAILGLGCSAPAEIRYETEHLRIAPTFDEPLCAGEIERFERHADRLEGLLGTRMKQPVTVYLWKTEEFPVGEYCAESSIGCYREDEHAIYTTSLALDHELVHAVAWDLGKPGDFFVEGVAEMLAFDRVLAGWDSPVTEIDKPRAELSYRTAGHFSRWLWQYYGQGAFLDLLATEAKSSAALESIYGLSIDAAAELYLAEAPYAYAPLHACEYPPLTEVEPGRWMESIHLDCDDVGTFGGPTGMGTSRVLEVEARADFLLETDAESLSIALCPDEDLPTEPVDFDPALGDVPPVTSAFRGQYVLGLSGGGDVHVLDLVPGRYEITVGQQEIVSREVVLSVERP